MTIAYDDRGTTAALETLVLRPVLAAVVFAALTGACTEAPGSEETEAPNDGLLRDFIDGKYDAAGHPLNAKVLEGQRICGTPGGTGVVELRGTCDIALPDGADSGGLTVNARIRVRQHPSWGSIATISALDAAGGVLGVQTLTVSRLRGTGRWIDLPISLQTSAHVARVTLHVEPGAKVDLDYVEVFPKRLGVIVSPGAGVYKDTDKVTIELPKGKKVERLEADGVDLRPLLDQLLADRKATRTTTEFRTLIDVRIGDLLPTRGDLTELRVHSSGDTSRTQIRKFPAPCAFEGDPSGEKVLITGFQPFPADGWHENISAVAVSSLDPASLRGAQVMRLVLPVEYDRSAAAIAEVIDRCNPSAVISFGQGGGSIALEETAYNLQDTGELSGGAPDNRGIIRAANPIALDAPPTRETLLPLEAIESALVDAGELPSRSDDPGRYICNNVMFVNLGKMAFRGRAGLIHLPYTTSFDDEARARWGMVAAAAVQATVDAP